MITTMIMIMIMFKPHIIRNFDEGNKIIFKCRLAGRIMMIMILIMMMIIMIMFPT